MGTPTSRLRLLLSSEHCPLPFRWNVLAPATPLQEIRRFVSRRYLDHRSLPERWMALAALWLTWPLRALMLTRRFTRRFGSRVAMETGKSRARQVAEQTWLASSEFLPASMYYRHELYRPATGKRTPYLHQPDAQQLLRCLTRRPDEAVGDKQRFESTCRAHGLPTVRAVGICREGALEMAGARPNAMFVKPFRGSRGEGTSSWRAMPDREMYRRDDGVVCHWTEVVSLLRAQSLQRPYLIQPLLRNHAATEELSSGAVATVRLVTGISPSGSAECIVAAFRMPAIRTSAHGLFSPIDLETGRVGRADTCRPLCPGYDHHPETGARIEGRTLPYWRETVGLGEPAHRLFPGYAFLGWDIAITDSGPLLLEANAGWDVISVQRPHRRSLMDTRFATICSLWMGHDET